MISVVVLLYFFSFFFSAFQKQETGDLWVVLIAGSNTYSNYRHQADVCQAYQQFHQAGVEDDRIVVWMYDDIAHYWKNPHKGSIINYKGGPNVYKNVLKDYTGKDITVQNFLSFLRGENMTIGSKKSLRSTENDRIFIYFTDHGGPGIICMPGMVELHVKDLMDTFQHMYDNKMYSEMVFYMEACESGSMFDGFEVEKMNIYAVTASNPSQSSYACDHDISYLAYLNDCWSRDFLNDTRWALNNEKMSVRTLDEQFEWVKIQSRQSPECRYGQLDYAKYTLDVFQGKKGSGKASGFENGVRSAEKVVSYDVPLKLMEKELEIENDVKKRNQLEIELKKYKIFREKKDIMWGSFKDQLDLVIPNGDDDTCHQKEKFPADCMKDYVVLTKEKCGPFDDYSAKYYKYLYQACLQGKTFESVEKTLSNIC